MNMYISISLMLPGPPKETHDLGILLYLSLDSLIICSEILLSEDGVQPLVV